MGVKCQTSNWAVELTTGLFNFKFRAKKMKFKYVIKNLFTKENIDNGWVRKIEGMTEFKKQQLRKNSIMAKNANYNEDILQWRQDVPECAK